MIISSSFTDDTLCYEKTSELTQGINQCNSKVSFRQLHLNFTQRYHFGQLRYSKKKHQASKNTLFAIIGWGEGGGRGEDGFLGVFVIRLYCVSIKKKKLYIYIYIYIYIHIYIYLLVEGKRGRTTSDD